MVNKTQRRTALFRQVYNAPRTLAKIRKQRKMKKHIVLNKISTNIGRQIHA